MDKISKLQRRLDSALAGKQFYEAHQILRTMHARLMAENRHAELLDLLHSGCMILCEGKEYTSAIDVAELYVDTLKKSGCTLDNSNFDKILSLFSQLPAKLDSGSGNLESQNDRRIPFLNRTLDWALKSAEGRPELLRGCAYLHQKFAEIYSDEGQEEQAERYSRAADYLLSEVDRLTKPPGTEEVEIGSNKEDGDEKGPNVGNRLTSEIDLD